jgi:hypothetical protein
MFIKRCWPWLCRTSKLTEDSSLSDEDGGNPEQLRSLAAWLLEQEAEEIVATVSTDLAHPAPGSSLRRTGPSGHQRIEAKAHLEDDPATPKAWLPDRIAESSTQPSTSAVIFDPGYLESDLASRL